MERIGLRKKNRIHPDLPEPAPLRRELPFADGEQSWNASQSVPILNVGNWFHLGDIISEGADMKPPEPNSTRPSPTPSREQLTPEQQTIENELFRARSEAMARARMKELVQRFADRAARARERMRQPEQATPTTPPTPTAAQQATQGDEIRPIRPEAVISFPRATGYKRCWNWWDYDRCTYVLDPQGALYLTWMFIVTLCYCYNAVVIPLRAAFPYQTISNTPIWLMIDSCCDVIYLIDVVVVKPRVSYLTDGFWVRDPRQTRKNYFTKLQFKLDVISLLPVELLYVYFGTGAVLLRLPRLFKVQTFVDFTTSLDKLAASTFPARIGRTLVYMFYLIHLNACMYYKVSVIKGIGSNGWVYNGSGNAYLRCFYFATKCATSIGKNPKPETEFEFMYMTFAWLMGVFVFALLIGQIRDIIATATRSQNEYRKLLDETSQYMRQLNLPSDLQNRVTTWFRFTWKQQHTLDESQILNGLPLNLKTDVAINVHIQTLNKVQLFNDCEDALLRDLVLKLRSVIFLPGDLICRKGEVGKEMYIVKMGEVQVIGGEDNKELLATLTEGCVFGEISLLEIDGGNRRTADVRSRGFSNLFVLSKSDLNATLVHYPDAQKKMLEKARNIMRKNMVSKDARPAVEEEVEAEIIIGNPPTPKRPSKLMETILQVVPEESGAGQLLRKGSRASSRRKVLSKDAQAPPTSQAQKKVKESTVAKAMGDCYCDEFRSRTLPKNLRRRKLLGVSKKKSLIDSSLYESRNCSSQLSLKQHSCTNKSSAEEKHYVAKY